jgi:anaerobic magnesium-protoporphyrin IX monomethyl ester cyclase
MSGTIIINTEEFKSNDNGSNSIVTKIAFINPRGFGTISEQGPHIGLAYLAASCQQSGHDVRVLALNNVENPDEDAVISDLACWGADIIGFTVTSFCVAHAIQMASKVRLAIPKAKIIAGGIHPTMSLKRFLNENHLLFDVIVLGEGDLTILEVIDCMDMNKPLSKVHGIAFIKDNDVLITPPKKNKKIDKLPFPHTRFLNQIC